VVSDTPRPRFSPGEGTPSTHCAGGWVGPRAGPDKDTRGKILSPLPGIEPRSPGRPARSQTQYWLSYPGSLSSCIVPVIVVRFETILEFIAKYYQNSPVQVRPLKSDIPWPGTTLVCRTATSRHRESLIRQSWYRVYTIFLVICYLFVFLHLRHCANTLKLCNSTNKLSYNGFLSVFGIVITGSGHSLVRIQYGPRGAGLEKSDLYQMSRNPVLEILHSQHSLIIPSFDAI
jgi:hypothetical protein